MSQAKHSPGAWRVATLSHPQTITIPEGAHHIIATTFDDSVALTLFPFHGKETREANARLIAAAPQMLVALQRLTHPMADDTDLEFALSVIETATGTGQQIDRGSPGGSPRYNAALPDSADDCEYGDDEYQWRLHEAGL